MKSGRQIEKYFKGAANHWRIEILILLDKSDGLTLEGITEKLNANFKTMSSHTKTLVSANLIQKKYIGHSVIHTLTPYGKKFIKFFNSF